jgi:hypothetical protein
MASQRIQAIINIIEGYASEAQKQGDPQIFLQRLSGPRGMHAVWHFGDQPTGTLRHFGVFGFLLFHWHLVQKVIQFFNYPALTEADFSNGGTYYSPQIDWNARIAPNLFPAQSIDDLIYFSYNFEIWHNDVHEVLEQRSGTPMGDASQNVLYPIFWQWHRLVNNVFEWQLQNLAKATGTSFNNFFEIVNSLENQSAQITNQI